MLRIEDDYCEASKIYDSVIPSNKTEFIVMQNHKMFIIDRKTLTPYNEEGLSFIWDFVNLNGVDVAKVRKSTKQCNKYNLLRRDGTYVLEEWSDEIDMSDADGGYPLVRMGNEFNRVNPVDGKFILDAWSYNVWPVLNDILAAEYERDGKLTFELVRTNGKSVNEIQYDDLCLCHMTDNRMKFDGYYVMKDDVWYHVENNSENLDIINLVPSNEFKSHINNLSYQ